MPHLYLHHLVPHLHVHLLCPVLLCKHFSSASWSSCRRCESDSVSRVWRVAPIWTVAPLWTVAPQALLSKGSLGKSTGVGCRSLPPGIFPAQGLNLSLLHCRQILCHLSHRGCPMLHFVHRQYWRDAARARKHLTSISQLSFLFAEYRGQWIGVWMAQSHLSCSDWPAPALHSSPILPTWQPVSQQLQLHPQAKGQLLPPTPSGYAGPLLRTSPGPWLMVSG